MHAPIIHTSTSHKVATHQDMKYWAEGGRLQIVDERDGDLTSLSIDEGCKRLIAFAMAAERMTDQFRRRELIRFVGDLKEVLYQAKEQGDPHDPKVLAFKARHRPRRTVMGYNPGAKGLVVEHSPLGGDSGTTGKTTGPRHSPLILPANSRRSR